MMNDEGKTGSEEAKKSGRAEKISVKISVICGPCLFRENSCNSWAVFVLDFGFNVQSINKCIVK